jgi:hypothetical protein
MEVTKMAMSSTESPLFCSQSHLALREQLIRMYTMYVLTVIVLELTPSSFEVSVATDMYLTGCGSQAPIHSYICSYQLNVLQTHSEIFKDTLRSR